jgi:hypothetical protein
LKTSRKPKSSLVPATAARGFVTRLSIARAIQKQAWCLGTAVRSSNFGGAGVYIGVNAKHFQILSKSSPWPTRAGSRGTLFRPSHFLAEDFEPVSRRCQITALANTLSRRIELGRALARPFVSCAERLN